MKRRARVNSAASPSQHRKYSGPRWRRIMSGTGPAAVLAVGVLATACSTATAAGGPASPASPAKSATPSHAPAPKARPPERLPVGTLGGYSVNENDMVNQPADMAYVIRRLLAVSDRSSGFLGGLIAPGKIAVAGQSDGGDTVAALVANTCCRYRDVTATIVLAGAEYPPMGGSYFTKPTPPMLFVQGDADNINLPADSIQMYRPDTTAPPSSLDLFAPHPPPPS